MSIDASITMLPNDWLEPALTPPQALGAPVASGRLRASPADFVVEEHLGFVASGAGQHVLLRVTKCGANTEWVQRELAKRVGCKIMDVGFAGLKDRHAVTTQFFTVPRGKSPVESWLELAGEGYRVLSAVAHDRKLPRGALAANSFTITVRQFVGDRSLVEQRIAMVARQGVPNYFGPQRFGRDGRNLLAAAIGRAPRARDQLGFALSAARSLIFNAVLAARVRNGTWNLLQAGDVANLDDSGSVFRIPEVDAMLVQRAAELDIHPSGPLWGDGEPLTSGAVLALEQSVAEQFGSALQLLAADRMKCARRALRLAVRDLSFEWLNDDALCVRFRLTAGSFATTVLREIVATGTDPG
jgi:tRNA pseudouridine13 synthase